MRRRLRNNPAVNSIFNPYNHQNYRNATTLKLYINTSPQTLHSSIQTLKTTPKKFSNHESLEITKLCYLIHPHHLHFSCMFACSPCGEIDAGDLQRRKRCFEPVTGWLLWWLKLSSCLSYWSLWEGKVYNGVMDGKVTCRAKS